MNAARLLLGACAALGASALVPASSSVAASRRGTTLHASFVADFMTAAQNAVASAAPGSGDKAAQKLIDVVCAPTGVDADAVAALCASYAQYEDLASDTFTGPGQIAKYFEEKYPEGTRVVCDRIAGDAVSGGFTWHREDANGKEGLRGTTFVKFEDGKLVYAREGSEPILKPGEATEALLKAATANIEKEDKVPTYEPRSPKGAYNIADYLWNEAYPKGATPAVALELFAEDIRYEDFNYPNPFLGKAEVKEFVEAFDIPGIDFVPTELSKGDDACCFTWLVRVNGNDGPKGISFYGSDAEGKIDYIRDIPATTPAPLQQLAALVNPALRKF